MDQPQITPDINPGPEPETAPSAPMQPERTDSGLRGETRPAQPERGREQLPNPEKKGPSQGVSLPPVQPPSVGNDNQAPAATTQPAAAVTTDSPLIADDVDVIEMEWVNKAKRIIKETKDNPHAQEQAVEQLQIDYLKKRYGKEIKKSRTG